MMANNCKFFRNFQKIHTCSRHTTCQRVKFYHNSQSNHKSYRGNWNFNRLNKRFKTISIVAAVGTVTCASSFISKKTDSLLQEETDEDEFDELFINEIIKKDIELLNNYGSIPYLIVGSSPAAIAAYRAIRIKDPTAKVIMLCEERYNPYKTAPLSSQLWYLKSHDPDVKRSHIFYNDYYLSVQQLLENKNGGLALIRGKKVIKIDPVSQCVFLDAGEKLTYEKCLLVPTTKSQNLPVFQDAEKDVQRHITLFHSLKDFFKLEKLTREIKSIAVIGGDILGSELAAGLNEYGKSVGLNVVQIFPEPRQLNNILPEYLSIWLRNKFESKGIHVKPFVNVSSVSKCNDKLKLHLSNNEIISIDHIVIAIGSEPNTDIALPSGLEIDDKVGGFLVNAEMKARKNLWIAGDSASFYDVNIGRCKIKYPESIIHSGQSAGENMIGNGKSFHYESNWWSVLSSEVFCEGVGNTDASLQTIGVFVKPDSSNLEPHTKNSLPNTIQVTKMNKFSDISYPISVNEMDFKKGVVFYLKDNIIVGILLWNIIADINIAKKVIKEHKTGKEVIEIARLFQSAISLNKSNDDVKSDST